MQDPILPQVPSKPAVLPPYNTVVDYLDYYVALATQDMTALGVPQKSGEWNEVIGEAKEKARTTAHKEMYDWIQQERPGEDRYAELRANQFSKGIRPITFDEFQKDKRGVFAREVDDLVAMGYLALEGNITSAIRGAMRIGYDIESAIQMGYNKEAKTAEMLAEITSDNVPRAMRAAFNLFPGRDIQEFVGKNPQQPITIGERIGEGSGTGKIIGEAGGSLAMSLPGMFTKHPVARGVVMAPFFFSGYDSAVQENQRLLEEQTGMNPAQQAEAGYGLQTTASAVASGAVEFGSEYAFTGLQRATLGLGGTKAGKVVAATSVGRGAGTIKQTTARLIESLYRENNATMPWMVKGAIKLGLVGAEEGVEELIPAFAKQFLVDLPIKGDVNASEMWDDMYHAGFTGAVAGLLLGGGVGVTKQTLRVAENRRLKGMQGEVTAAAAGAVQQAANDAAVVRLRTNQQTSRGVAMATHRLERVGSGDADFLAVSAEDVSGTITPDVKALMDGLSIGSKPVKVLTPTDGSSPINIYATAANAQAVAANFAADPKFNAAVAGPQQLEAIGVVVTRDASGQIVDLRPYSTPDDGADALAAQTVRAKNLGYSVDDVDYQNMPALSDDLSRQMGMDKELAGRNKPVEPAPPAKVADRGVFALRSDILRTSSGTKVEGKDTDPFNSKYLKVEEIGGATNGDVKVDVKLRRVPKSELSDAEANLGSRTGNVPIVLDGKVVFTIKNPDGSKRTIEKAVDMDGAYVNQSSRDGIFLFRENGTAFNGQSALAIAIHEMRHRTLARSRAGAQYFTKLMQLDPVFAMRGGIQYARGFDSSIRGVSDAEAITRYVGMYNAAVATVGNPQSTPEQLSRASENLVKFNRFAQESVTTTANQTLGETAARAAEYAAVADKASMRTHDRFVGWVANALVKNGFMGVEAEQALYEIRQRLEGVKEENLQILPKIRTKVETATAEAIKAHNDAVGIVGAPAAQQAAPPAVQPAAPPTAPPSVMPSLRTPGAHRARAGVLPPEENEDLVEVANASTSLKGGLAAQLMGSAFGQVATATETNKPGRVIPEEFRQESEAAAQELEDGSTTPETVKDLQRVTSTQRRVLEALANENESTPDKVLASLRPITRKDMTPEMQDWSEGSTVVDEEGSLIPVYHGTPVPEFDEFKSDTYRGGLVAFVSTDPNFAGSLANENGGRTIPLVLNIQNPFDFRDKADVGVALDEFMKYSDDGYNVDYNKGLDVNNFATAVSNGDYAALEQPEFVEFLRDRGHDGVIMQEGNAINYGVFDPNQIKGYFNRKPTSSPKFMASMRGTTATAPQRGETQQAIDDAPDQVETKDDFVAMVKAQASAVSAITRRDDQTWTEVVAKIQPVSNESLTKEQREWSRDSVVRDKGGKLIPVFHGTSASDFDSFMGSENGTYGSGIYTSTSVTEASKYAESGYGGSGAKVIPLYLNIKNPFVYNKQKTGGYSGGYFRDAVLRATNNDPNDKFLDLTKLLQQAGYDGVQIVAASGYDAIGRSSGDHWIAFEPNQTKGYFNPKPTSSPKFMASQRKTAANAQRRVGKKAPTNDTTDIAGPLQRAAMRKGARFQTAADEIKYSVRQRAGRRPANEDVRRLREEYLAANNLVPPTETKDQYVEVSTSFSREIADWFESSTVNPDDPAMLEAYAALGAETKKQYLFLQEAGYSFVPWGGEGQPYASSKEMLSDLAKNKRLFYFKSVNEGENAFGSADGTAAIKANPLLADAELVVNDSKGKPYAQTFNDLFRAVHDVFGHSAEGYQFGQRGEENAYRSHYGMFTPLARGAMATETRGQNSWLNFGPNRRGANGVVFGEDDPRYAPWLEQLKNGVGYADQKPIVMPVKLQVMYSQRTANNLAYTISSIVSAAPSSTAFVTYKSGLRNPAKIAAALADAQDRVAARGEAILNSDEFQTRLGMLLGERVTIPPVTKQEGIYGVVPETSFRINLQALSHARAAKIAELIGSVFMQEAVMTLSAPRSTAAGEPINYAQHVIHVFTDPTGKKLNKKQRTAMLLKVGAEFGGGSATSDKTGVWTAVPVADHAKAITFAKTNGFESFHGFTELSFTNANEYKVLGRTTVPVSAGIDSPLANASNDDVNLWVLLAEQYAIAIQAEGFDIDFDAWAAFAGFDAITGARVARELRRAVASRSSSSDHGIDEKYLTNYDGPLPKKSGMVAATTTPLNVEAQLVAADQALANSPDAFKTLEATHRFLADLFGSRTIPNIGRFLIKSLENKSRGMRDRVNDVFATRPQVIYSAIHGLQIAQRIAALYNSGHAKPRDTVATIMWAFMSRGVNTMVQESMWFDLINTSLPVNKPGVPATVNAFYFFDLAIRDEWTPEASALWLEFIKALPVSTGAAATHNANAFGKDFLSKIGAQVTVYGVEGTVIQHLHNAYANAMMQTKDVRRVFHHFGGGLGIDNKIVSFSALALGKPDGSIMDRVRIQDQSNADRSLGDNAYDGHSLRYDLVYKQPVLDDTGKHARNAKGKLEYTDNVILASGSMSEEAVVRGRRFLKAQQVLEAANKASGVSGGEFSVVTPKGRGLASAFENLRGAVIYEAAERQIDPNEVFADVVIKDPTIKPFVSGMLEHWVNWNAASGQEANHASLEAVHRMIQTQNEGTAGTFTREGQYDYYAYGSEYGYIQTPTGREQRYIYRIGGNDFFFTPPAHGAFVAELRKEFARSGFGVSTNPDGSARSAPWFNDPRLTNAVGRISAIATKHQDQPDFTKNAIMYSVRAGASPDEMVNVTRKQLGLMGVNKYGVADVMGRRAWEKSQTGQPITLSIWHSPSGSRASVLTEATEKELQRDTLLGKGWYGSRDRDVAEIYGTPEQFFVKLKNPYVIETPDKNTLKRVTNKQLQEIREAGHDGIVVKAGTAKYDTDRSHLQVVAFDMSSVQKVNTSGLNQAIAYSVRAGASPDEMVNVTRKQLDRTALSDPEKDRVLRHVFALRNPEANWVALTTPQSILDASAMFTQPEPMTDGYARFNKDNKLVGINPGNVWWHMSPNAFTEFDARGTRTEAAMNNFGTHLGGLNQAMSFAGNRKGDYLYPLYVSAKNPLRVKDMGLWNPPELLRAVLDAGAIAANDFYNHIRELSKMVGMDASAMRVAYNVYTARSGGMSLENRLKTNTYTRAVLDDLGIDALTYENIVEGLSLEDLTTNPEARAKNIAVLVWNPTQIKSIVTNNGEYSQANPDIRKSVRVITGDEQYNRHEYTGQFWDNNEELLANHTPMYSQRAGTRGALDETFHQAVDKYNEVRRYTEQAARTLGGRLRDNSNPYLGARTLVGRLGAFQMRAEQRYLDLMHGMTQNNIGMANMDEFLIAQHALERNAYVRSLVNGMPDGGSGMTDSDATTILNRHRAAGTFAVHDAYASQWRDMLAEGLLARVQGGLITQETYNHLTGFYTHYVPLRGAPVLAFDENFDESGEAFGRGMSTTGRGMPVAAGRRSTALGTTSQVGYLYEDTMRRVARNEVGQRFLRLVQLTNDPGMAVVERPTMRTVVNGAVRVMHDPTWASDPRNFGVYVNEPVTINGHDYVPGDLVVVRINNRRLQEGMNSPSIELRDFEIALRHVNNAWRTMTTGVLNPVFAPKNLVRDVLGGSLNNIGERGYIDTVGTLIRWTPSFMRVMRDEWFGRAPTGRYAEFVNAGGDMVAWEPNDLVSKRTDFAALEQRVLRRDPNDRSIAQTVLGWYPAFFKAAETATRLAQYQQRIASGASPEQAALAARDITVDFAKGGMKKGVANTWYMFLNAGIQGTVNTGRGLRGAAHLAPALVGLGVVNALMCRVLAGYDDDEEISNWDKIPSHEKASNFFIFDPSGSGKYIKVPLPYGYNAVFSAGVRIADAAAGDDTVGDAVSKMFDDSLNAFNPLGGSGITGGKGGAILTPVPTMLKPWFEVMLNEDWSGRRIQPQQFGKFLKPDSSNFYEGTPSVYTGTSAALNAATGGDGFEEGGISISPNTLQHMVGFYLSGAGRLVNKTMQTLSGEGTIADVPFAGSFVGDASTDDRALTTRYMDLAVPAMAERERVEARADPEYTPEERAALMARPVDMDKLRTSAGVKDAETLLRRISQAMRSTDDQAMRDKLMAMRREVMKAPLKANNLRKRAEELLQP